MEQAGGVMSDATTPRTHHPNPDLVFDLVNGAMLYRALVGEPLDEDVADGIADLITKGAGTTTLD